MMHDKRGQLTVFIIIGITILVAGALFYFVEERTSVFNPDVIIPGEAAPVKEYLDQCIQNTAEKGLIIIGQQGGYIDIPERIQRNPSSYLSYDPFNIIKIPYWQYKSESRIPPLDYIRKDLEEFINSNVSECALGLEEFSDEMDIKTGDISSKVEFTDDNVIVEVRLPVKIYDKRTGKKIKIRDFRTIIPVRLKRIHELANATLSAEVSHEFLENLTINLMAAHPYIPFTGMEFDCSPKRWLVKDIKKIVKELLAYNLPRVRIVNTDYAPFNNDTKVYEYFRKYTFKEILKGNLPDKPLPEDSYEYFNMFFDVGSRDPSLKIKFVYLPEWSMDLRAYPSSAGIMSSNMMKGARKYLSFLCINVFHFTYDVSYPVEVRIRDDNSLGGRGYVFRYAIPVMIKSNLPDRHALTWDIFEGTEYDTGFCENLGGKEYNIIAKGLYDGFTDSEVPGVNITYICINKRCDLGYTKLEDGRFMLKTKVPESCTNPIIIAENPDYIEARSQLDSKSDELIIPLKKLKKLDFTVVKHIYNSYTKTLGDAQPLEEGDSVAIAVYLVNSTSDFSQYIQYPGPENFSQSLKLAEEGGTYSVNLLLSSYGVNVGGYINEDLKIPLTDLLNKNKIVFHVFEYSPEPMGEEDIGPMTVYLMEGNYSKELKPTFE